MSVRPFEQTAAIRDIGETIIGRVSIPKDRWEIAAQLEVLGYRDADARNRFGCKDLFDVADNIFALFQEGKIAFSVEGEDPQRYVPAVVRFLRHYLDGLMFSLPMVLQGCTMLLWGYGLWGAVNLDARTGSAIALGFIASYIVTSGFSWAIISRGLFYHYQSEGGLARWSALRMWSLAVRVAIGLAVPAFLFSLLYRLLPLDMSLIAMAYYAALVVLWLNWSLIYLVHRTHWLLVAMSFSIVVVLVAARVLQWPIVAANLTGMAILDVLSFAIGYYGLKKWARDGAGKPTVNPPRLTVLIYATAPVFLYGLLYSAFIFTDRVLAWTASRGREDFPPYPFWLSARYELGMDLALIVIVILAGVIEYSTHRFSSTLIPSEKRVKSAALEPFLDEFAAFYRKHATILIVAAVAAIAVAAGAVRLLRQFPDPRLQESLASSTTMLVFWVAAISYAIFMFALQNVLTLLILSRTDLAIRVMAISILVNLIVGFAGSRTFHYSGAVFGLLAGSLVLAILAHRTLRRVLGELDYYYYAAF